MQQVLLNLQSNALKFTQSGSVKICVQIIEKEQQDLSRTQYLQIEVIDSGVGVPYEDQDKLFKLFGFVKTTSALNINGIGLGLVISKQIVKKFNGKIDFSSTPWPEENHGSNFNFVFELSTQADDSQPSYVIGDTKYRINSTSLVFDWRPSEEMMAQNKKEDIRFTVSSEQNLQSLASFD